jgi:hypothetical protein
MRFIGNAPVDGEVRAIASGALATGDAVIVNSDGTVGVISGASGGAVAGTPAVFENADTRHCSATYDSNTQKVVVAYRDRGNSDYGTAIVGTVSGTSISFGAPVVFEAATVPRISATYDANAQKIVIAYADSGNSSYGTAIVGTVSGTSISFGTPVVFESADTRYISATYAANAQKIVIAYSDDTNSEYGTAIVGTVSGTSISFGSAVVFESADTNYVSATYDSNTQKIVIAYQDGGNLSYGTAIVGTVSGTSISFGAPVVFSASNQTNHTSATYDSNAQKVVIAYQDNGNSGYGTAIVGTVSGTSISFGSAVVFESADSDNGFITYDARSRRVVIVYTDNGNSGYGTAISGMVSGTSISFDSAVVFESGSVSNMSSTYDANAQGIVIAYRDGGNSGYGTSAVFQPAYTSTNLTSENFVGFANSGYADGQSAAINSTCSVDKNQSGLTAGETYYVQTDGTLGTTPASPSVVAGTAISSNSIIVKG